MLNVERSVEDHDSIGKIPPGGEVSKTATRTASRFTFVAALLTVIFLFAGAQAQEKKVKTTDQKEQMMEMMKDPSMMNMMMDRIASDPHMRTMMMDKMMMHAKSDSASMMSMCRRMMKDKDMHDMMMKMMMGGGMMDHHKMQKKSADTTMTDHESHHKKD